MLYAVTLSSLPEKTGEKRRERGVLGSAGVFSLLGFSFLSSPVYLF